MAETAPRQEIAEPQETIRWLEVPGGRVRTRGFNIDKPGVPVLIVHGGPGYSSLDEETYKDLADDRPIYLWDQLDSGESQRPNSPKNWTVERFVQELADVRRGLGLEKVHLVGHSWGGIMLNEYLLTHKPEGVVSATFASPMLSMRLLQRDIRRLLPEIRPDALEVLRYYEQRRRTKRSEYKHLTNEIERRFINGESLHDNLPPGLKRSYKLFNYKLFKHMIGSSPVSPTGVLKDYDRLEDLHLLNELHIPILFTGGRRDLMSPETLAQLQGRIDGAELAIFEKSAHMPHFTERIPYMNRMRQLFKRAETPLVA